MNTSHKGFSVAALVLGIVAACTGILFYFSIPTGITAIVFAAISLKKKYDGRGMALAGLITGIIGLAFGLLLLGIYVAALIVGANNSSMTTY